MPYYLSINDMDSAHKHCTNSKVLILSTNNYSLGSLAPIIACMIPRAQDVREIIALRWKIDTSPLNRSSFIG